MTTKDEGFVYASTGEEFNRIQNREFSFNEDKQSKLDSKPSFMPFLSKISILDIINLRKNLSVFYDPQNRSVSSILAYGKIMSWYTEIEQPIPGCSMLRSPKTYYLSTKLHDFSEKQTVFLNKGFELKELNFGRDGSVVSDSVVDIGIEKGKTEDYVLDFIPLKTDEFLFVSQSGTVIYKSLISNKRTTFQIELEEGFEVRNIRVNDRESLIAVLVASPKNSKVNKVHFLNLKNSVISERFVKLFSSEDSCFTEHCIYTRKVDRVDVYVTCSTDTSLQFYEIGHTIAEELEDNYMLVGEHPGSRCMKKKGRHIYIATGQGGLYKLGLGPIAE